VIWDLEEDRGEAGAAPLRHELGARR
jgi:hypothetical protein